VKGGVRGVGGSVFCETFNQKRFNEEVRKRHLLRSGFEIWSWMKGLNNIKFYKLL